MNPAPAANFAGHRNGTINVDYAPYHPRAGQLSRDCRLHIITRTAISVDQTFVGHRSGWASLYASVTGRERASGVNQDNGDVWSAFNRCPYDFYKLLWEKYSSTARPHTKAFKSV